MLVNIVVCPDALCGRPEIPNCASVMVIIPLSITSVSSFLKNAIGDSSLIKVNGLCSERSPMPKPSTKNNKTDFFIFILAVKPQNAWVLSRFLEEFEKSNLVELCNSIAKAAEFEKLSFVNDFIGNYDLRHTEILIALHACDTATDDAIFQAIKANAEIIMVAPCCHHEIRPQIKAPEMFKNILKHGVLLEKMAETITDGLRALILEKMGYKTKVFEFISPEHTPKNNMIVAVKNHNQSQPDEIDKQIQQIKNFYGIKEQRLENLLAS